VRAPSAPFLSILRSRASEGRKQVVGDDALSLSSSAISDFGLLEPKNEGINPVAASVVYEARLRVP